jgi:hypothetical protein
LFKIKLAFLLQSTFYVAPATEVKAHLIRNGIQVQHSTNLSSNFLLSDLKTVADYQAGVQLSRSNFPKFIKVVSFNTSVEGSFLTLSTEKETIIIGPLPCCT